MTRLIVPPSCQDYIESKTKILRTGLNAPRSDMKKIVVPESMRKVFNKLSTNKQWYSKHMIGFIHFIADQDFSKLQMKRFKKLMREHNIPVDCD